MKLFSLQNLSGLAIAGDKTAFIVAKNKPPDGRMDIDCSGNVTDFVARVRGYSDKTG